MEQTENIVDVEPRRRQNGAMIDPRKTATIRSLDRINLRLPAATFDAIDQSRTARAGNISRNTWITEAVEEKLAREHAQAAHADNDRLSHG